MALEIAKAVLGRGEGASRGARGKSENQNGKGSLKKAYDVGLKQKSTSYITLISPKNFLQICLILYNVGYRAKIDVNCSVYNIG